LRDHVRLGAAGKVVSAFDVVRMMALGADWCNSARGFMFALGCIQAQHCHTGFCPTGVTTQDPVRQQALVVPTKAERVYQFHQQTLEALRELIQAAGLTHPQDIGAHHIVRRVNETEVRLLSNLVPYMPEGALLDADLSNDWASMPAVYATWWVASSADSFALPQEWRAPVGDNRRHVAKMDAKVSAEVDVKPDISVGAGTEGGIGRG
jgi:Conserved region in glutamate synthase